MNRISKMALTVEFLAILITIIFAFSSIIVPSILPIIIFSCMIIVFVSALSEIKRNNKNEKVKTKLSYYVYLITPLIILTLITYFITKY